MITASHYQLQTQSPLTSRSLVSAILTTILSPLLVPSCAISTRPSVGRVSLCSAPPFCRVRLAGQSSRRLFPGPLRHAEQTAHPSSPSADRCNSPVYPCARHQFAHAARDCANLCCTPVTRNISINHRLAALLTKRPLINRTITHFHHILATSYWVKGVARLPARIGKVRHSVFTTTTLAKKGSSRLAAA